MKDIIYFAVIGGIFILNLTSLYRNRKKDNNAYKMVLLSRHMDWLLAFAIVFIVISMVVILEPYIPEFLKFGLFSLLDKGGTNANIEVIQQSAKISPFFMVGVFLFLMLLIPKSSYWEEIGFRYGITEYKKSIFKNIKFGLVHCIVGVPIWIGLLLILVGFIYTWKYIREYKKTNDMDIALEASTSLHGKYNSILIILLLVALSITQ